MMLNQNLTLEAQASVSGYRHANLCFCEHNKVRVFTYPTIIVFVRF